MYIAREGSGKLCRSFATGSSGDGSVKRFFKFRTRHEQLEWTSLGRGGCWFYSREQENSGLSPI